MEADLTNCPPPQRRVWWDCGPSLSQANFYFTKIRQGVSSAFVRDLYASKCLS